MKISSQPFINSAIKQKNLLSQAFLPAAFAATVKKKGRRKKRICKPGGFYAAAARAIGFHRPYGFFCLFVVVTHKRIKLNDLEELLERKLHLADFFDKLVLHRHDVSVILCHLENSFRLITLLIILKKIKMSSDIAQQSTFIFVQNAQRSYCSANIKSRQNDFYVFSRYVNIAQTNVIKMLHNAERTKEKAKKRQKVCSTFSKKL